MANSLSSNAPREPKLDGTIIAAVLICAALAAAFAYWRMGPGREVTADELEFGELKVNKQKLEQQRQEKYKEANLQPVQSEWQDLLRSARELNEGQFGGLDREKQQLVQGAVRVWAHEVIVGTGYDAFVYSGEPMFRECQEGLDALLGAVQRGDVTLEVARTNPPADKFEAYRKNCGNLLPILLERGLVNEKGRWSSKSAPTIADLLNRYRWAHLIHDQKDPWAQLTAEGARLLARWRVEQAKGYDYRQRTRYLNQLANQFPDYNAHYAAGVLAYRAGKYATALEHFEKLAKAHPRSDFDKYADFVRKKVGGSATSGSEGLSEEKPSQAKKSD